MSVLKAVTGSDLLLEHEVIVELLHPGPPEYLPLLHHRAERVRAPGGRPSELPSPLGDGATRRIVARGIAWQHYRRAVVTLVRLNELAGRLRARGLPTMQTTTLGDGGR